jgi:hypothetical protein
MSVDQVMTAESACTKSWGAAIRGIWEKNIGDCGISMHSTLLISLYVIPIGLTLHSSGLAFLLTFVSLSTLMIYCFLSPNILLQECANLTWDLCDFFFTTLLNSPLGFSE